MYFGYGEVPNSYMPKVNFWSDKVEKFPYDIEKATALVKEAGYDGTPIHLMVDTGNAPFRTIATNFQAWPGLYTVTDEAPTQVAATALAPDTTTVNPTQCDLGATGDGAVPQQVELACRLRRDLRGDVDAALA